MLKVVDPGERYEKVFHEQDCAGALSTECKCPVFVLRRLTGKDGNEITNAMTDVSTGEFKYLPGVARQQKIFKALVDWRNVTDAQGNPVPCNDSTKEILPFSIHLWLEDIINRDNGFGVTQEQRKNS